MFDWNLTFSMHLLRLFSRKIWCTKRKGKGAFKTLRSKNLVLETYLIHFVNVFRENCSNFKYFLQLIILAFIGLGLLLRLLLRTPILMLTHSLWFTPTATTILTALLERDQPMLNQKLIPKLTHSSWFTLTTTSILTT